MTNWEDRLTLRELDKVNFILGCFDDGKLSATDAFYRFLDLGLTAEEADELLNCGD